MNNTLSPNELKQIADYIADLPYEWREIYKEFDMDAHTYVVVEGAMHVVTTHVKRATLLTPPEWEGYKELELIRLYIERYDEEADDYEDEEISGRQLQLIENQINSLLK